MNERTYFIGQATDNRPNAKRDKAGRYYATCGPCNRNPSLHPSNGGGTMLESIASQSVMIYADPITRNVEEDPAVALCRIAGGVNVYHDEDGTSYVLETWIVRFPDGMVLEREIRRDYVEA